MLGIQKDEAQLQHDQEKALSRGNTYISQKHMRLLLGTLDAYTETWRKEH